MKDWEELYILQQLRQEQRKREMMARNVTTQRQEQQRRARIAENRIIGHLRTFWGYDVHPTTHSAPFDAWVGGCRVEIKVSNWQKKRRRYQGNIRQHKADVLLFVAVNGIDNFFLIPMAEIHPRKTIEINQYHVQDYQGQWSAYLENWSILDQAIAQAPPKPIQLRFDNGL
jgi:hypothetical protein